MTPNAIEILLHCYLTPMPHPRRDAPAVQEAIEAFLVEGLIEAEPGSPGGYRTTDRGTAHVKQLCNLPLPEQGWIGANGMAIDLR